MRKFEFVIPSSVFLADPQPWPPIRVTRDPLTLTIQKPVAGQISPKAPGELCNQGLDVHYTIIHVDVEAPQELGPGDWGLVFPVVDECLKWIRVLARHYWIGTFMSGNRVVTRGGVVYADGTTRGFGAYQSPIMTYPLSLEQWNRVGRLMNSKASIPTSQLVFCDGMLRFRESDWVGAVVAFAMACDIEVNRLIPDLLDLQTIEARDFYESRGEGSFEWKLKKAIPFLCGRGFSRAKDLALLYSARNKGVHHGQCYVVIQGREEPVGFELASTFFSLLMRSYPGA